MKNNISEQLKFSHFSIVTTHKFLFEHLNKNLNWDMKHLHKIQGGFIIEGKIPTKFDDYYNVILKYFDYTSPNSAIGEIKTFIHTGNPKYNLFMGISTPQGKTIKDYDFIVAEDLVYKTIDRIPTSDYENYRIEKIKPDPYLVQKVKHLVNSDDFDNRLSKKIAFGNILLSNQLSNYLGSSSNLRKDVVQDFRDVIAIDTTFKETSLIVKQLSYLSKSMYFYLVIHKQGTKAMPSDKNFQRTSEIFNSLFYNKPIPKLFHIQFLGKKKWCLREEKNGPIEKYFQTKNKAIEFAKIFCEKNKNDLVIHRKDLSIENQINYSDEKQRTIIQFEHSFVISPITSGSAIKSVIIKPSKNQWVLTKGGTILSDPSDLGGTIDYAYQIRRERGTDIIFHNGSDTTISSSDFENLDEFSENIYTHIGTNKDE